MSYITTYTKIHIDPLTPKSSDLCIEDIAHALSLLCRAGGHFKHFYSVGQHSINCMREAKARGYSEKVQLACLLHDASEAYLSDITRPVKAAFPEYRKVEHALQTMIWDKFLSSPLTDNEYKQVFEVDDALLYYEFLHFMQEAVLNFTPELSSVPVFEFVGFEETEKEFMRCFASLSQQSISSFTVGVDWCSGRWLAVAQQNGELQYQMFSDIYELCHTYGTADMIIVDIPIGLPETAEQSELRPDKAARRLVKGRSSSFFPTPFRQIVYAEDAQEIKAWEKRFGKGNSVQALSICGQIRQVDAFLQNNVQWKNRLLESHPELAFYVLNKHIPMAYPKLSQAGKDERIDVLRRYCKVDTLVKKYLCDVPGRKKTDDLLDALSLAIIGKLGMENGLTSLPESPSTDSTGLLMQMVITKI